MLLSVSISKHGRLFCLYVLKMFCNLALLSSLYPYCSTVLTWTEFQQFHDNTTSQDFQDFLNLSRNVNSKNYFLSVLTTFLFSLLTEEI